LVRVVEPVAHRHHIQARVLGIAERGAQHRAALLAGPRMAQTAGSAMRADQRGRAPGRRQGSLDG
jgi:hypothetical protein